ncbi:MAG: outer membrane protein assembly factor BamA [Pseudomonadota bacterium]
MKFSAVISAVLLFLASFCVRADSFVVENIEVTGLKKITIGTIFSYLPINVGEALDVEDTPEIIRELYSTGFFDDIELRRRDNDLIIKVHERPSIAEVNFDGNKDIEDEALQEALVQVGMAKGRIFNENNLEKLQLELQQVYYSLGKYAARIEASWRKIDEDRVAIDISLSEGVSARIKSINITGNSSFREDELLDLFQLEPSSEGLFANDEYSSTKLTADLEQLRSYYLDRGYVTFEVKSQQVTISPDRKDISISISVDEGEQYKVSSIEITGEMVVDVTELEALVSYREGDTFSRKETNKAVNQMKKRLGEDGYAYAEIRTLPEVNEEDQTVAIRYLVIPGNKMRVRYINFAGNDRTKTLVLRREMRQMEGELYKRSKVDRSRVRLQRLNYLATVGISLEKVPDSDDLVDLQVTVTERFSGNLALGIGYSQAQGALLNLGFTHDNILGTGNSVSFTFNNSSASEEYAFRYRNPYYTPDGISRGFNIRVTETDASENNLSNYLLDRIEMSVDYGIPLSEYDTLRLELGLIQNKIETTSASADEVFQFITDNSDEYDENTPQSEIDGAKFDSAFGAVSISKDTRNRRIFASAGALNSVRLELTGGDLDFYKLLYRNQMAYALSDLFTLTFRGRVGYGEGYNDTPDLPIFEKYTAGGVRSVRGYEFNSLGPLDSTGDPFGGNLQVVTTTEIIFPIEALGSSETFRLGVYFDAGNVFADAEDFEADELRQSVGLSAKWFSIIGPIEFSYAFPLNDESEDDTQNFQFALGAAF